jgi:hypothetical protein
MADTLGARLVRAGLLTRDLLSQAVAHAADVGVGLPEALIRCGLSEDALAGFFLSAGYGPLLEGSALSAPDREAAARVGRRMSEAFLALPVRRSPSGVVLALADPTDEHAVREIERRLGAPVLPKVARVNDLRRAIEQVMVSGGADVGAAGATEAEPVVERAAEVVRAAVRAPRPSRGTEANAAQLTASPGLYRSAARRVGGSVPMPFALPDRAVADESWGDLDTVVAPPVNERRPSPPRASQDGSPRGRLGPKVQPASALAAPGDAGTFLAAIRAASTRDEMLLIACEGALSVASAAVFLGIRKGVLVGWEGMGPGISRDAIRNLWIPATTASVFKRVIESGRAHHGPYGTSPADQLFRAATGSRGARLGVQPVFVGSKITGVLCADDARYGEAGEERLAVLGHAIGEGFKRLILAQRA